MTFVSDFRAYHWARAGIGSPIEEAAIDATIEIRSLEDAWNQPLDCESAHSRRGPCSITVTHLAIHGCGAPTKRICTNAAREDEQMREDGWRCVTCGNTAHECWRIVGPI